MNDPFIQPGPSAPGPNPDSDRRLTAIIYLLYGLAIINGITAVVAIIINYVKRADVAGTWLESHFRWQIHTFWWSLAWAALGGFTMLLAVGWLVWFVAGVWYLYRIIKGWLYLNDGKAMYG